MARLGGMLPANFLTKHTPVSINHKKLSVTLIFRYQAFLLVAYYVQTTCCQAMNFIYDSYVANTSVFKILNSPLFLTIIQSGYTKSKGPNILDFIVLI